MSAHTDKTLHKKVYNINDTDAFSLYPSLKMNTRASNSCVNSFFLYDFMYEFMYEIGKSYEFVPIFLHEKSVMLRMVYCITCTVSTPNIVRAYI